MAENNNNNKTPQKQPEDYFGVLCLVVCVSTKDIIKMLPSSIGMAETPSECVLPHCTWSCPFLHPQH